MAATTAILVIEDDHDTRVLLRECLEKAGYLVFTAANGIDALSMLQQIGRPDLILLDQGMPMMSGADFIEIKNQDPHLADIPVVTISGAKAKLGGLGIVDFLEKPLDLSRLIACVQAHTKKS